MKCIFRINVIKETIKILQFHRGFICVDRYFINWFNVKGQDSFQIVGTVLKSHTCPAFCIASRHGIIALRNFKLISQAENDFKSCRGQFIVLLYLNYEEVTFLNKNNKKNG